MTRVNVKTFYVYILTNRRRTVLYVGITNSLERLLWYHRTANPKSFTGRYRVDRLVYYEQFDDVRDAISREKQIKGWRRSKKEELVVSKNPAWRDLRQELFGSGSGKVTAREQMGE